MFCIAPIVDDVMTMQDTVSFWAVGVDCCGMRSDFTCGDSAQPTAHDAVVQLEAEAFVPPYMEGQVPVFDPTNFYKAMNLGYWTFGTKNKPRGKNLFVTWTKKPFAIQHSYYED